MKFEYFLLCSILSSPLRTEVGSSALNNSVESTESQPLVVALTYAVWGRGQQVGEALIGAASPRSRNSPRGKHVVIAVGVTRN